MGTRVAYNQIWRFENQFPKDLPKLAKVTNICETRYDENLPKTDNFEEFIKRPVKYTFNVYPKSTKLQALPVYNYTFTEKQEAKLAYKYCMNKWIDEQLEPYRAILQKGKTLTLEQLEICESIQNLYVEED